MNKYVCVLNVTEQDDKLWMSGCVQNNHAAIHEHISVFYLLKKKTSYEQVYVFS